MAKKKYNKIKKGLVLNDLDKRRNRTIKVLENPAKSTHVLVVNLENERKTLILKDRLKDPLLFTCV
ncbi:MAG: hypothetical protein ACOC3V_03850 [bacterium]